MSTLTPNRILQKGDEYSIRNGTWVPVPDKEVGLQIMFSGLPKKSIFRRPTEKEPTISPNRQGQPEKPKSAEAEGSQVVPHRVAPVRDESPTPVIDREIPVEEIKVPSIAEWDAGIGVKTPVTLSGRTAPIFKPIVTGVGSITQIKFPEEAANVMWTGRNGTFYGKGLQVHEVLDDCIAFQPIGQRGTGNCLIEIPKAILPELINVLAVINASK